jgi:mannose-6-phosphate isomerase-like protein (cupin superfamily)
MITRLYRSKSDIENLSRLKTTIPTGKDRYDYKKFVVNKPWGYEYLMFENKEVSIWILSLNRNESTSMHCHPNKKTTLIVIRGEVLCTTLEGFFKRKAGEGLAVESSVFHTTKAVSRGGAIIMEMESPPNKRDLVRLKDLYGR